MMMWLSLLLSIANIFMMGVDTANLIRIRAMRGINAAVLCLNAVAAVTCIYNFLTIAGVIA